MLPTDRHTVLIRVALITIAMTILGRLTDGYSTKKKSFFCLIRLMPFRKTTILAHSHEGAVVNGENAEILLKFL